MKYPDRVKIASTTTDGYGDTTVTLLYDVKACFINRSSISHEINSDTEISDASIYLDHTNTIVLTNKDSLEGMYIIVEPFTSNDWYRISSRNIAQRKLLNNSIDNIYCRLNKIAGLPYVLVS